MAEYEVSIAYSARREIKALPKSLQERIEKVIDSLETNPRPRGTIKLKGKEDVYRIKVSNYRIIFTIDDKKRHIDISYIRHRGEAYRK